MSINIESSIHSSNNNLESIKATNNQNTIKRIQKCSQDGARICLFVGRTPQESLPVEKDVIWVSLDNGLRNAEELSPDKFHLIVDCNDADQMACIQHLFTKVIVDQSTWKFFKPGIIERLSTLLIPSPESTLVFESAFQFVLPKEEISEWEFDHILLSYPTSDDVKNESEKNQFLQQFIEKIGGIEKLAENSLYLDFKQQLDEETLAISDENDLIGDFFQSLLKQSGITDPADKYIPLAREKTQSYLATLFEKVELKQDTPYPYPTRYSSGHDTFFVATGPKQNNL